MSDLFKDLGKQEPKLKEKEEVSNINDKNFLDSILTADGEDGNFRLKEEPKPEELEDEDKIHMDFKTSSQKRLGKYSKDFISNVMKHPTKFFVETERGTLSIKDAIEQGWDPKTGGFKKDNLQSKIKEKMDKLSDSDREAVDSLTNPDNAGIADADADGLDIPPESRLRKTNRSATPEGQIPPELLAKLNGGEA